MALADRAFNEIENHIAYGLHTKKHRSDRSVKPEGYCHQCEEEVEGEKLFCNGKCATLFGRAK